MSIVNFPLTKIGPLVTRDELREALMQLPKAELEAFIMMPGFVPLKEFDDPTLTTLYTLTRGNQGGKKETPEC